MNTGEGKVYAGAAILGLAVFHGLGVAGIGTDIIAEWIATLSLPAQPDSISRLILGVLAASAAFLIADGYLTARDGVGAELSVRNGG